jgi:hypothetical protein
MPGEKTLKLCLDLPDPFARYSMGSTAFLQHRTA